MGIAAATPPGLPACADTIRDKGALRFFLSRDRGDAYPNCREEVVFMDAEQSDPRFMRKVVAASFVGALLEWYDFFLYGTASALVFNRLFFSSLDPNAGLLASFATFGAGFVARPLGGVICGHYGDKLGRKNVLVITLIIMGIGTFCVGCLPTYETAGLWAPGLLVFLRLLQGIGLGGEYGGAALITIEHAPRRQRGFWGAFPQSAVSAGILLATGVFALCSRLPDDQFLSWGWRLPFLLSLGLLVVGMYIRLNIGETPAFQKMKDRKKEAGVPLFELLRRYPKTVLVALGARLGETVSSNILNAFGIAYVSNNLGLSKTDALIGIFIASAIGIFACPVYGYVSDRIGRRPIYLIGASFLVLFAFPFFMMLNSKSLGLIWLAIVLGYTFGPTMMFSVQGVFFSELFGTNVRYSGLSVAYQFSAILGGFTPLIATVLQEAGHGQPWYVAGFLMAIAIMSLGCTLLVGETYKTDVSEREDLLAEGSCVK
jgi:MHS family shikimate/dehydroshikimate transporter-like MFS transporter